MCGICVVICFRKHETCASSLQNLDDGSMQDLHQKLKNRGPNYFQESTHSYQDILDIHFISSVLHLRGAFAALQPIEGANGDVFLWNGEIFGGPKVDNEESDAKILSDELFKCNSEADCISYLSSIKGPFSYIFYQAKGLLWFGRDIFGRRSLLWNADESTFRLCSVAFTHKKWSEVTTDGIFCLDLNQSYINKCFTIYLYPWSNSSSGLSLQPQINQISNDYVTFSVKSQLHLCSSINTPLNNCLPSKDILKFSIAIVDDKRNKYSDYELISKLNEIKEFKETVIQFEEILSKSVERRVHNHQHLCKDCFEVSGNSRHCDHTSVGILFSGGLDSIVIACLADRFLKESEPIDLINVAFASTRGAKNINPLNKGSIFDTPDRITGRNGVNALCKICPKRRWNFVEVNTTEDDLIKHRTCTISHLLNPCCTVLDDSIGCALWFAAQGNGVIASGEGYMNYRSPARVLLLGMGADEQLGGYARHRGKFGSCGWPGLIEELSMELDRIGSRNLGRDDRIIADSGVESRYPFLDECVVSFLNSLPVWLKMNLNYPRGTGEKLLLRLLAFKLGLIEAAVLPKRAIQFGSRIARIENSKEKGSDICERLKVVL